MNYYPCYHEWVMQHWNMHEPGLDHLQLSLQINIFVILRGFLPEQ